MLCSLRGWLTIEAMAIIAPGVIGSRARGISKFAVERLAGDDFGLTLLPIEHSVLEKPAFVADGNVAVGLLTDCDTCVA